MTAGFFIFIGIFGLVSTAEAQTYLQYCQPLHQFADEISNCPSPWQARTSEQRREILDFRWTMQDRGFNAPARSSSTGGQAIQSVSHSTSPEIAISLPPIIHECDINCNTLTLVNGNYVLPPHAWERPSGPIVWTVESFTPSFVALHRRYPVDHVFSGRIAPDGTTLTDVAVNGNAAEVRFAWGAKLNTVYGSNEERDRAKYMAMQKAQLPLTQAQIQQAHNADAAAMMLLLGVITSGPPASQEDHGCNDSETWDSASERCRISWVNR